MGTHLFNQWTGRSDSRTAGTSLRSQRYAEGASGKAATEGGRRPDCRSTTATSRECVLKKLASLGFGRRATPAQKTLVIQKLRQTFPLAVLLSIAQIPRATYYYHAKRQTEPDKYGRAKKEIEAIYHENKGRYGYRRITTELRRRGFILNHKTVQRLMKDVRRCLPGSNEKIQILQG